MPASVGLNFKPCLRALRRRVASADLAVDPCLCSVPVDLRSEGVEPWCGLALASIFSLPAFLLVASKGPCWSLPIVGAKATTVTVHGILVLLNMQELSDDTFPSLWHDDLNRVVGMLLWSAPK